MAKEDLIKAFSYFSKISENKIRNYLNDNSIQTLIEHPETINPTPNQLKNIESLGKLKRLYGRVSNYAEYKFEKPQEMVKFLETQYETQFSKEEFHVCVLDKENKLLGSERVSVGSLNASIVHPRHVMKKVLAYGGDRIVLSHNHPSGDPIPSIEDRDITRRLERVGRILDIKVLDHIIIGRNKHYSFVEEGDIQVDFEIEETKNKTHEKMYSEDVKKHIELLNKITKVPKRELNTILEEVPIKRFFENPENYLKNQEHIEKIDMLREFEQEYFNLITRIPSNYVKVTGVDQVSNYMRNIYSGHNNINIIAYLDTKNGVLSSEILPNNLSIEDEIKYIMSNAILHDSNTIILASKNEQILYPKGKDRVLAIRRAADAVGINLLDNVEIDSYRNESYKNLKILEHSEEYYAMEGSELYVTEKLHNEVSVLENSTHGEENLELLIEDISTLDFINGGLRNALDSEVLKSFTNKYEDISLEQVEKLYLEKWDINSANPFDSKVAILQLGKGEKNHNRRFLSTEELAMLENESPNVDNYEIVLIDRAERGKELGVLLRRLYREMNDGTAMPSNFYGHSLSKGDIVVLADDSVDVNMRVFYTESIGFSELYGFLDENIIAKLNNNIDVKVEHEVLNNLNQANLLTSEYMDRFEELEKDYKASFLLAQKRSFSEVVKETPVIINKEQFETLNALYSAIVTINKNKDDNNLKSEIAKKFKGYADTLDALSVPFTVQNLVAGAGEEPTNWDRYNSDVINEIVVNYNQRFNLKDINVVREDGGKSPVEPSYYIVEDMSTWSNNSSARSEIERFNILGDAIEKFKEYRQNTYDYSDGMAKLTMGVSIGLSELDVVQVRNNENYLMSDFTTSSVISENELFLMALSDINEAVGFDKVRVYANNDGEQLEKGVDIEFESWSNNLFDTYSNQERYAHGEEYKERNDHDIESFIVKEEPKKYSSDLVREQLERGIRDVMESERFKDWCATCGRHYANNYSFNNAMLTYLQKPESTYVMGYEAWKGFGRQVSKGAKGVKIITPTFATEYTKGGLYGSIRKHLKEQLQNDTNLPYATYNLGQSKLTFTMQHNGMLGLMLNGKDVQRFNSENECRKFIERQVLGKVPMYYGVATVFDISDTYEPEYLFVKSAYNKEDIVLDENGDPIKNRRGQVKVLNTDERKSRLVTDLDLPIIEGNKMQMDTLFSVLQKVSEDKGVPMTVEPIGEDGVKGYYERSQDGGNGRIVISDKSLPTERVATAFHEMAHASMHRDLKELSIKMGGTVDRGMKEVQAEAVAFMTAQNFGIDTEISSFSYLAGWSKGKELSDLRDSLDMIFKESKSLMKSIEKELSDRGLDLSLNVKNEELMPKKDLTDVIKKTTSFIVEVVNDYDDISKDIIQDLKEVDNEAEREIINNQGLIVKEIKSYIADLRNLNNELIVAGDKNTQDRIIGQCNIIQSKFEKKENEFNALSSERITLVKNNKNTLKNLFDVNPMGALEYLQGEFNQMESLTSEELSYLSTSIFIAREYSKLLRDNPKDFVDKILEQIENIRNVQSKNGSFVEIYACEQWAENKIFEKGTVAHPKLANRVIEQAEKEIRKLKIEASNNEEYYPYNKCRLIVFSPDGEGAYSALGTRVDIGDGFQDGLTDHLDKACEGRENREVILALYKASLRERPRIADKLIAPTIHSDERLKKEIEEDTLSVGEWKDKLNNNKKDSQTKEHITAKSDKESLRD